MRGSANLCMMMTLKDALRSTARTQITRPIVFLSSSFNFKDTEIRQIQADLKITVPTGDKLIKLFGLLDPVPQACRNILLAGV